MNHAIFSEMQHLIVLNLKAKYLVVHLFWKTYRTSFQAYTKTFKNRIILKIISKTVEQLGKPKT